MEGFLTSVLVLTHCRTQPIHFDSGRDPEYNRVHWLIDAEPSHCPPLARLHSQLSMFGVSYLPSYAPKRANAVDRRTAHQIWGPSDPETVDPLEMNFTGTRIKARMTRIRSRRAAESRAQRPFYPIAIDLIYIVPTGGGCIDGSKYALHSMDEDSDWHEIATFKRKDKPTLTRWLMALVGKIQHVYNADEPTLAGTKEPDGPIDRAGGVLTQRARAMRIHAISRWLDL
ncbi:hypothetical protein GQ43DRAFT_447482 [Delitschia confertaspora ATCC 74209]|uniref:Uncharacterized protein n=1 Tax=Delitschia confertaspora ATCC 74209 TaxID=1513339 RepID=A0A9P4JPV2_9PLEO|nr:hypothetical protein GQ43DRAFT_447482 [Delitschia confertaspora ATCC 74209]